MRDYLFDTNILIDYLKGFEVAIDVIENSAFAKISQITWIEVMVGTTVDNVKATKEFLNQFDVVMLDQEIAQKTVEIRQQSRIKLPDAIIWATAKHLNCQLVTRNTKDFASHEVDVFVPYHL